MLFSFLGRGMAGLFARRAGHPKGRRRCSVSLELIEGLEQRLAMSTTTVPAVEMLSATTTDSKSVTIEYRVNTPPDASSPIQFGVYRSSNGQFDASDSLVATVTLSSPGSASSAGAITLDAERSARNIGRDSSISRSLWLRACLRFRKNPMCWWRPIPVRLPRP